MSEGPEGSTSQLLKALSDDVATLVRQEVRRAQGELAGTARQAAKGAALLGGAGVLGALAAGTSAAMLVRALDRAMPRPLSAAVVTLVYGGAAAGLAAAGVTELRHALPVVPEATVSSLQQDVAAARGRAQATPAPGEEQTT